MIVLKKKINMMDKIQYKLNMKEQEKLETNIQLAGISRCENEDTIEIAAKFTQAFAGKMWKKDLIVKELPPKNLKKPM